MPQRAQSPTTVESPHMQPSKEASYTATSNPVSKNLPEEACSDTPLSSDPYDNSHDSAGASSGSGDYFKNSRKIAGGDGNSPRAASPAFFIPHSTGGTGSGAGAGHSPSSLSSISPSPSHPHSHSPVLMGSEHGGVRHGGGGMQCTSLGTGGSHTPGGLLEKKESMHPLRHSLGADQIQVDGDDGGGGDRSGSSLKITQTGGGGARGDNRTEEEQVKMAPPGEGKVARTVERTREEARKRQEEGEQQGRPSGAHVPGPERGVKYKELGLGEEHGQGRRQGQGQQRQGPSESGNEMRRSTTGKFGRGQRHGRIRGEVSLDGDEAGLERKKVQQSWDREQIREARSHGRDVDGGSFGAQPHAEIG